MTRIKILVVVDLGSRSRNFLEFTREIAEITHAKVSCLHIIEDFKIAQDESDSVEKTRRYAETKLAKYAHDIFNNSTAKFDIIVSRGKHQEKIFEIARSLNVNYILIENKTGLILIPHNYKPGKQEEIRLFQKLARKLETNIVIKNSSFQSETKVDLKNEHKPADFGNTSKIFTSPE
ncbi:MAG: universal stress protein [Bacteroidales bacterium]|nr:universal stress protein [Bacteroidales bacterium]